MLAEIARSTGGTSFRARDPEALEEVDQQAGSIDGSIDQFFLDLMLDGRDDARNAIVSINAGAGGTEAQDWAEMLMRMYIRYGERKGFKVRELDYQEGDVAGIKSVSLEIDGEFAEYCRSGVYDERFSIAEVGHVLQALDIQNLYFLPQKFQQMHPLQNLYIY